MAWLAEVQLNSIFHFSPIFHLARPWVNLWFLSRNKISYGIIFSTTYRDTRWETLNYYCKSRNTSTTNLRLTIPITLNNFSTCHRYCPYCKGKVQIERLCIKKLLLGQPSHEYQDWDGDVPAWNVRNRRFGHEHVANHGRPLLATQRHLAGAKLVIFRIWRQVSILSKFGDVCMKKREVISCYPQRERFQA